MKVAHEVKFLSNLLVDYGPCEQSELSRLFVASSYVVMEIQKTWHQCLVVSHFPLMSKEAVKSSLKSKLFTFQVLA